MVSPFFKDLLKANYGNYQFEQIPFLPETIQNQIHSDREGKVLDKIQTWFFEIQEICILFVDEASNECWIKF